MFKINCHQIVHYFGDACQSPQIDRSGLRDR
nr:MAG TPA: phospholipase C/S1-P1 nuclease [Caudoviricetes sp.]